MLADEGIEEGFPAHFAKVHGDGAQGYAVEGVV